MRFIQEFGYSVKVGMEEEHQRWLQENEEAFARSGPEGTRYLGTFTTVFTSEKGSGGYRTLIELDSYGAMDRVAAAMKDASSDFGRLIRESSRFTDLSWDAPWSQSLYKAVVDATIIDPTG